MTTGDPAKVAFLILSDDPEKALPGLVMAGRMKANRGADVRVLFFGPGVKLAASGSADEQLENLRTAGARHGVLGERGAIRDTAQVAEHPIELLAAGAEVEEVARQGYTVLSF